MNRRAPVDVFACESLFVAHWLGNRLRAAVENRIPFPMLLICAAFVFAQPCLVNATGFEGTGDLVTAIRVPLHYCPMARCSLRRNRLGRAARQRALRSRNRDLDGDCESSHQLPRWSFGDTAA